jgi:hypothetical protein
VLCKHEVAGSNPVTSTNPFRSSPDIWVTECTGYTGNNFGPIRLSSGSRTRVSRSEYPDKADQPDVVVNFFDADSLAGKDRAEVNLFAAQTDAVAKSDDNDFEGIIEIGSYRLTPELRIPCSDRRSCSLSLREIPNSL